LKTLKTKNASRASIAKLSAVEGGKYILRLFIAGASLRSQQALIRVRRICETELKGNFELTVIDVYQQPKLARDWQIVAIPTLVKEFPLPMRRFIGNFSDVASILSGEGNAIGEKIAV
jgi:circadian clock protein KaiB